MKHLVNTIMFPGVDTRLKAFMIRMLSFLYIDAEPNTLVTNNRCFNGYLAAEDVYKQATENNQNEEYVIEKYNQLFIYFNDYFKNISHRNVRDDKVTDYDVEVIKCTKLMLKYGLVTH